MSIPMILAPMFVLVITTFVLLFWSGRVRVQAVRRGEVHPRDIALGEPNWGKHETQIANAYHNQLELPFLFYILTILAMATRHADLAFVLLAWVFVALRLIHIYIHVTSNHVWQRFAVFTAGFVVLAIMWAVFIIRIMLLLP
jgi:hypothetical protein